jgi:starch synthase (maltosyl-transferring)
VRPCVDCGRFPVKRILGDAVEVTADVFGDGHDRVSAVLRHRHERDRRWREVSMTALGNDRWTASFPADRLGLHRFCIRAWVDRFATWRADLEKRVAARQDVAVELEVGVQLIDAALAGAPGQAAAGLRAWRDRLLGPDPDGAVAAALDPELAALMRAHDPRPHAVDAPGELAVRVEPELARASAWYELFPRSFGDDGRHGTLRDVGGQLERIARMGFDVLYLPPVHPIGVSGRKGRNNATTGTPDDVGSPWAIGAEAGGHTAVHPALGTVDDVRWLAAEAERHGIALALDLAFQCSPDHPWVREHPAWFRHRPDGSIRYAENPPKRYEDIYPIDFESEDWQALWQALLEVVLFWIDQGVRVFRVDNPHTKPFAFWEWMIGQVKRDHPEVLMLSEAFTRPRVMERLAKLGFSQSYTYFTWRTAKWELVEYLTELTHTDVREYLRPNFWPNTPDILTEQMQTGGRPMFAARFLLAATLSSSYGVYGPAFELVERRPLRKGSEEYRDSEKYQLRSWRLDDPDSLEPLMTAVNAARREHPALRSNEGLHFHAVDNDQLMAYSKRTPDGDDVVLVIVNLDARWRQSGWTDLALAELGVTDGQAFELHDELSGATYVWRGARNYVELDPARAPGHLLRVVRARQPEPEAAR